MSHSPADLAERRTVLRWFLGLVIFMNIAGFALQLSAAGPRAGTLLIGVQTADWFTLLFGAFLWFLWRGKDD